MRKKFNWLAFTFFALAIAAQAQNVIQLEPVISGLSSPVLAISARDNTNRLFIIEQAGKIRVMASPTATTATTFLDLSAKIACCGERGLLGLAFHPQFATNRKFYVNYTRIFDGTTVVAEYTASANNPNVADIAERVLLTVDQPYTNHNGGMIAFGADEFLYIGMGDGGSGNDPENRAQNIESLLGKMLRIDVNNKATGLEYAIPPDNPFVNAAGRDEIFATGLRNPWRFSFDRQTGDLFAGDVGQDVNEEIDIIRRGGNYGWRVLEGTRCTNLGPGSCNNSAFIPPIYQYAHVGPNCSGSVTGGFVYRGTRGTFPAGTYLFGEFCFGTISQLTNNGSAWQAQLLLDTSFPLSGFGEDEAGELYALSYGGALYRFVNAPPRALATVSAARYVKRLAPDSIAATFGTELATGTSSASTATLPTALLETRLYVRDAAGTTRLAPLFYVSPGQVNFLVPTATALGLATFTLTSGTGIVSQDIVLIDAVYPGLFTANTNGSGVPSAVALRIGPNGSQSYEEVARFDQPSASWVPVPIDLGSESDQVFLVCFGTGFRGIANLANATATIGGTTAEVLFAGSQGQLTGLDQTNIRLPRSLIGRGAVNLIFSINGAAANTVQINVK